MGYYDTVLVVYCLCFLGVGGFCYGWEIVTRTPWKAVRDFPGKIIEHWTRSLHKHLGKNKNEAATSSRTNSPHSPHSPQSPQSTTSTTSTTSTNSTNSTAGEQQIAANCSGNADEELAASHTGNKNVNPRASKEWYGQVVILIPSVVWMFCLVPALKSLAISKSISMTSWGGNSTNLSLNPDIGGIGIRIGIYIPVGLAIFTLFMGLLHNEDSGAKEIGSAQLLTLFYLNFNALKAAVARFKGLTFPEMMAACMCIDLTAAGLQMTTSGKEALAARWFIVAAALNQLVSAAMVCAMLASIQDNYSFSGDDCAYINWWGRVDSCSGPPLSTKMYLYVRCLIMFHGLWLDWRYAEHFHVIEKDWSTLASGDQETDKLKINFEDTKFPYGRLRATVFWKWLELIPSIVVAIMGIEILVGRVSTESKITDWGQSAALVLAIAGAIHWLYVVYQVWIELGDPDDRKLRPVDYPRYEAELPRSKDELNNDLLDGAKNDDVKDIRRALRHGADVDTVRDGMTALLWAVRHDNPELVIELKSHKHNAKPDVEGTLPALSLAAQEGRMNALKALLPKPVIDDAVVSNTSRHFVHRVFAPIDRLFATRWTMRPWRLKRKARDPGEPWSSTQKNNPLWLAVFHGEDEAVEYMLSVWNKVTRSQTPIDKTRPIPIGRFLDDDLRSYLIRAMKIAGIKRSKTALRVLLRLDFGLLPLDDMGSTALHWACKKKMPFLDVLAEMYVESKISLDLPDKQGRTPLYIAAIEDADRAAGTLLRWGADPFLLDKEQPPESPISLAVKYDKSKVAVVFFDDKSVDQNKLLDFILDPPADRLQQLLTTRYIWPWEVIQNMPLIIHALARRRVTCFLILLEETTWSQSMIRPDATKADKVLCKASDIGKWLQELRPLIPEKYREQCLKRIIDRGGGRYFEDPPIEYTTIYHGDHLISPGTFWGRLNVRDGTNGGRSLYDGTEARIVFTSIANDAENATQTLDVTIWTDRGIAEADKMTAVQFQLNRPLTLQEGDKFSIRIDDDEVATGEVLFPSKRQP